MCVINNTMFEFYEEADNESVISRVTSYAARSRHSGSPRAAARAHRHITTSSALEPRTAVEEVLQKIESQERHRLDIDETAKTVTVALLNELPAMPRGALIEAWVEVARNSDESKAPHLDISVDKICDIAKAVERVMGTHEDEEAIIVHCCKGLGTLVVACIVQRPVQAFEGDEGEEVCSQDAHYLALHVARRLALAMQSWPKSASVQEACAGALCKAWGKLDVILGLPVGWRSQAPEVRKVYEAICGAVPMALQHSSSRQLGHRVLARTMALPEALAALGDDNASAPEALPDILSEVYEGIRELIQWSLEASETSDNQAQEDWERAVLVQVSKQWLGAEASEEILSSATR